MTKAVTHKSAQWREELRRAKELFDYMRTPGLKIRGGKLVFSVKGETTVLLEVVDDYKHLYFHWYSQDEGVYNEAAGVTKLILEVDAPIENFVLISRNRYAFLHQNDIARVLDLNLSNTVQITGKVKKARSTKNITYIPLALHQEVTQKIRAVNASASSYKASHKNYLINGLASEFSGRVLGRKTFAKQGEFAFLTHKLNLPAKRKKEDYQKFFSDKDLDAAEELFDNLLEHDLFHESFLKRLDDYFLKEKLSEIIDLGKKILTIGRFDAKGVKCKEIIKLVSPDKKVGQLEALWQEYFQRYLLYLIFSYRQIFPKVELELDAESKKPDFVGINHYFGVDVIEIKTHNTPILVWDNSHKNYAFSAEMSKAITQTMNYMDAIKRVRFQEDSIRDRITDLTSEENLYSPRGVIIISSYEKLVSRNKKADPAKVERDFTKLRNCLSDIEIMTFDEVIGMAERYRTNIISTKNEEN